FEAASIFGAALCVLLVRKGWRLCAGVGEDVALEHDGLRLEPFIGYHQLVSGEMLPSEWVNLCTEAGVASEDLGAVGAVGAAGAQTE
ncbi:MAG: hypothetical protein P8Z36_16455, partial [Gemmatimonadota bacterium]